MSTKHKLPHPTVVKHRIDMVDEALRVAASHLRALGLHVLHRVGSRNIPHLVITRGNHVCAVAWFFSLRQYRVFYPYGTNPQFRCSCPEVFSLVDAVRLVLDPDPDPDPTPTTLTISTTTPTP